MLTREMVGRTIGQNWHYVCLEHVGVPFVWHYHPEFELTLTVGAQGTRYIGGNVARFDNLDLALVAPNQAHTWYSRTPSKHTRIQVVFFTLNWLKGLAENGLPELAAFTKWLGTVHAGVVLGPACSQAVLAAFDLLHHQRDIARLSSLMAIFEAISRDKDAIQIGGSAGTDGTDARLDAALDFLHANYMHPISLEAVANAASTSQSTIKRLLRLHLRASMVELLIQLRIGHACHLLVSTEKSVGLVASESGFSNPGHFFALFRHIHKIPPSEFRARHHFKTGANIA